MRVWRYSIGAMFALAIGCAGQPQFGTFVVTPEPALRSVAADVVQRVRATWPPEKNALQLLEDRTDPFAVVLAAELRRAGYRVFANDGESRHARKVHFAVDTLGASEVLRVTMFLPGGQWSRAYRKTGKGARKVAPVGPWTVHAWLPGKGDGKEE